MHLNGQFERRGRDVIRDHYAVRMAAFHRGDIVTEIGPFIVDGPNLVTEIATIIGDRRSSMVDLFSIQDGKITRLACYPATPGCRRRWGHAMASRVPAACLGTKR